jgi:transposase-like protein
MRKPGYVSPAKAARMVGVCEATIRNWIRNYESGRRDRLTIVEINPVTRWALVSIEDINKIKSGPRNR